ncbi:hypothetical protein MHU86_349 [Fragilaria crotonensis]|nr:hypothetical protein MHU86_349 [Fragilaria crotonensis]
MQKEWRDLFSNLCVSIGQPLDADAWLSSVEEMDRRATHAKESARMARRKLMMGFALRHDAKNSDNGVFIEHADDDQQAAEESAAAMILGADGADADDVLALLSDKSMLESTKPSSTGNEFAGGSSLLHSAPFLSRALSYMHRHHVPFEHIDLWVPSFVPNTPDGETDGASNCRLCYAGNATVEMQSGMPTWEQSVMNAPHHHFERGGGARQWGIRTVVGIPIASPSVGRIVVVLYSRHDREKDQELVGRLSDEFTKLMPSPKWKLVVDIGEPEPLLHLHSSQAITAHEVTSDASIQVRDAEIPSSCDASHESVNEKPRDSRIDNVIALLGEFMPSDPSSPIASYLPGFMSLRLMLLRPSRAAQEEDVVRTMLGSYSSYSAGGRTKSDIAVMLARDYMFLVQQQTSHSNNLSHSSSPFLARVRYRVA